MPGCASQSTVRGQLRTQLRNDADFNAFVIDWFPEVHARFGDNMDRVTKENLLLSLVPSQLLAQRLGLNPPTNNTQADSRLVVSEGLAPRRRRELVTIAVAFLLATTYLLFRGLFNRPDADLASFQVNAVDASLRDQRKPEVQPVRTPPPPTEPSPSSTAPASKHRIRNESPTRSKSRSSEAPLPEKSGENHHELFIPPPVE